MTHLVTVVARCQDRETLEKRLACLADAGPEAISARLDVIADEWSAGRMTKSAIGVSLVLGLALASIANPWWLILPALGGVFLLQNLFHRNSWLGAAFHGLGYRAGSEIDEEKYALKTLRGDFRNLPTVHEIENRDDISRLEGEGGIALDPEEAKPDAKDVIRETLDAVNS